MYVEIVQISYFIIVVWGSLASVLGLENKIDRSTDNDISGRAVQNKQKDGISETENDHPTQEKDFSWLVFTGRMIKKRHAPIDRGIEYRKRRETSDDIAEEEIDDDPNAGYGPWLSWGSCGVSCGLGRSLRRRICTDPTHCSSGDMEIRICDLPSCIDFLDVS